MPDLKATIRTVLEDKGLIDAKGRIDELQRTVDGLQKQLDRTNRSAGGLGDTFGDLGDVLADWRGKLAGYLSAAYVVNFARTAVLEFWEVDRRIRAVGATIQSFGGNVREELPRVREFIEHLRDAAGVTADESVPAFQKLAGLTESVGAGMELTRLAVSLSKQGFGDLARTSELLAGLLQGEVAGSAKSLGLSLKDANGHTRDAAELLRILFDRAEDFRKSADGTTGTLTGVKGAWAGLKAAVGEGLSPIGAIAVGVLTGALEALRAVLGTVTNMVGALGNAVLGLGSGVWSFLRGEGFEAGWKAFDERIGRNVAQVLSLGHAAQQFHEVEKRRAQEQAEVIAKAKAREAEAHLAAAVSAAEKAAAAQLKLAREGSLEELNLRTGMIAQRYAAEIKAAEGNAAQQKALRAALDAELAAAADEWEREGARRRLDAEKSVVEARKALHGQASDARLQDELRALDLERRARIESERLSAEEIAALDQVYAAKRRAAREQFERARRDAEEAAQAALLRSRIELEKQGSAARFVLEVELLEREKAAAVRKAQERGESVAAAEALYDNRLALARERRAQDEADRQYARDRRVLEARLGAAEKGSDAEYALREKLLTLEFEHAVASTSALTDDLYALWEEYWAKLDALAKEHTDRQNQQALDSAEILARVLAEGEGQTANPKAQWDAEIRAKEAYWAKEREKFKGNAKALENIQKAHDADLANLDRQHKRENAERQKAAFATSFSLLRTAFGNNKAFAIAEAIVNTYQAAAQALTVMPPWLGIALAAMDVAAGLAYVSKIQSTDATKGAGFDDPVNDAYAREMGGRRWARDLVNQIGSGFRSELAAVASPFGAPAPAAAGGTTIQQAGDTYNFHGELIDEHSIRSFMRRARRVERRDGARYQR